MKESIAKLETRLTGPLPDVDAAQTEWEKSPGALKTQWNVVTPLRPISKGGADLKILDDNAARVMHRELIRTALVYCQQFPSNELRPRREIVEHGNRFRKSDTKPEVTGTACIDSHRAWAEQARPLRDLIIA